MTSDEMPDDRDPLAQALRADAARVAPRSPADLAERTKARVRAEQLAPKRIRFVPWLAVAAAAAGFAVGVIVFAGGGRGPEDDQTPQVVIVPHPAPIHETPAIDLSKVLPTPQAPFDQELARMRGDARAAMGFLLDTLPVAKKD